MKAKRRNDDLEVFAGSGNVFADLGLPDAEEHDLKAQLAVFLIKAIKSTGASQAAVANRLGVKQPHVSQLMNFKLQGFSAEKLMLFLTRLGHSVQIGVSSQPHDAASICVVAESRMSEHHAKPSQGLEDVATEWTKISADARIGSLDRRLQESDLQRDVQIPTQEVRRASFVHRSFQ